MSSENKKMRKLHNKNLLAILFEAQLLLLLFLGGRMLRRGKKSKEFQFKGVFFGVFLGRMGRKREGENSNSNFLFYKRERPYISHAYLKAVVQFASIVIFSTFGCIFQFVFLLRELLSPQQHYDWGLRALKTILRGCGTLLQTAKKNPEGEQCAGWGSFSFYFFCFY